MIDEKNASKSILTKLKDYNKNNMKNLCYASDDVFTICAVAEKVITDHGERKNFLASKIYETILHKTLEKIPFNILHENFEEYNSVHTTEHRFFLIQFIAGMYIGLKIKHILYSL